jgi:putative ABC transport system substrate-binding protein
MATPVGSDADIEAVMTAFAARPGGGVVAIPDSFTAVHRKQLLTQAERNRLPVIWGFLFTTLEGGLISYAVDPRDLMHRAASYVDRILKGDKASDLPVQQPTKFRLIVNLQAAKAIGLTIPESLLLLADEVIE